MIETKDWKNWTEVLPVEDSEGAEDQKRPVMRPRPGHADLTGAIKYNFRDARYLLERASARETAVRVAEGALAKAFLAEFGNRSAEPCDSDGSISAEQGRHVGRSWWS